MPNHFIAGIKCFAGGFPLLKHPRILPWVLIPLAINSLLFYFAFDLATDWFDSRLQTLLATVPEWLNALKWLLWILFGAMLLLILAFSFTLLANLVGSPFYGLMAEQAGNIVEGTLLPTAATHSRSILLFIPAALLRELQKLFLYLRWFIPVLLLSLLALLFTPVATLTPTIWFGFGAWMCSIEYLDYHYDNHNSGIKQLRLDISRNRLLTLGFGSAAAVAAMIPILNIIAVPAAVCGAAELWALCNRGDQAGRTSTN
jgi:CysZ protein